MATYRFPSLLALAMSLVLPVVRSQGSVDSFMLVNTETNEDIRTLSDGDTLYLDGLPPFTIVAVTSGAVNSVNFNFDDSDVRTENAAPFALTGDTEGDYFEWDPIPLGEHHLIATPYKRRRNHAEPPGFIRREGRNTVQPP